MKKKPIHYAIIAALFSIFFSIIFKWAHTGNPFRGETIMYATIIFINIIITGSIAFRIFRKYSNRPTYELQKNVIRNFILFVLIAFAISIFIVSIGVYSYYLIKGYSFTGFWRHLFTVELAGASRQFAVWTLAGSVIFFYSIWRKAIEKERKLREENMKFRYQTLKSQVNPHFLFNSLNTLSELGFNDALKADQYIRKLSSIYRYVIENEETMIISLQEEINFVRDFFDLQKERDNGKIDLSVSLRNTEKYGIIPVSLQVLVENALKHNAASVENPLKIRIFQENNFIVVANNIQRKNRLEGSTKTGLVNLGERIRLISEQELILTEKDNEFLVKIPLMSLTS